MLMWKTNPTTEDQNSEEAQKKKLPRKKIDKYQLFRESHVPSAGRVEPFLEAFDQCMKHELYSLPMQFYMETCAKCGNCTLQCHLTADDASNENYLPPKRADLLRKIYKRRHTLSGKLLGKLVGAEDLTEEKIDEMYESFYRCTMCRRCALECPMGVDNSLITRVGRVCLSAAGMAPNNFQLSVKAQLEGPTKNSSAIPERAFVDTLEFLDEEMEEMTGIPITFPINKENSDYLLIAPVSDYIMEADTLMGIAMTMYAAGANWTVATGSASDSINYGLFYDDRWLKDIITNVHDAVINLGIKTLVVGECGHATKTQKVFAEYFNNNLPFKITNIMTLTESFIKEGRIKLDKSKNPESVTLHDPCNLSRMGGLSDSLRFVLTSAVENFIEMNPTANENYCCGGGGGTVGFEEIYDFRMEVAGKKKVDQIKETGAHYLAAPCANCKKQLRELVDFYKIDTEVVGIHDLVAKALIFDKPIEKSDE